MKIGRQILSFIIIIIIIIIIECYIFMEFDTRETFLFDSKQSIVFAPSWMPEKVVSLYPLKFI